MHSIRTLKEIVTTDDVSKLSEEEMYLRNSILELSVWCKDRLGVLERGRKRGFRMGVTQEAAEAIEAVLPYPEGMKVAANLLRVK